MSDRYLPDLVKLNSYWQKAVEDAIRETVKGEKRLHSALKNRRRINKKLTRFGLNPIFSTLPFSEFRSSDERTLQEMEPDSDTEESTVSLEDESCHLLHSGGSRSKTSSTPMEEEEDNQRSPVGPLFGNGSLDKIKKSQNSFNCEPMGSEENSEEQSASEKGKAASSSTSKNESDVENNKNIQWLHVRNDRYFEYSDSDSSSSTEDGVDSIRLLKHPHSTNKKYFSNKQRGINPEKKLTKLPKTQGLLSGGESNNPVDNSNSLKRRLELAIAKREILNKKRKVSSGGKSKTLIKVSRSAAKEAEKQAKGKNQLSSFIRFYLEVYRELCLKMPVKRIGEEAAKRWRAMNAKEKAKWTNSV